MEHYLSVANMAVPNDTVRRIESNPKFKDKQKSLDLWLILCDELSLPAPDLSQQTCVAMEESY